MGPHVKKYQQYFSSMLNKISKNIEQIFRNVIVSWLENVANGSCLSVLFPMWMNVCSMYCIPHSIRRLLNCFKTSHSKLDMILKFQYWEENKTYFHTFINKNNKIKNNCQIIQNCQNIQFFFCMIIICSIGKFTLY
jgi:hypothetical protein